MNILKFTLTSVLLILSMGAGPCELMQDISASDTTDGGTDNECGNETCKNKLIIEMLTTDSQGFQLGTYSFSIQTPDKSVYSIDCYLNNFDYGFTCELGDTDVMYPYLSTDKSAVQLAIAGAPDSLIVVTSFNDFAILEKEIVPTYDKVYPNGENCLPVCYSAQKHVAVSTW